MTRRAALPHRPVRAMPATTAGALALLAAAAAVTAPPAAARTGHAAAPAASRHTGPVPPGTYYLIEDTTNRGTTIEVHTDWDWLLLGNQPGGAGEAFTFEADGDGYTIKSPLYHWDGYNTWCALGVTGIKLTKPGECGGISHFTLTPAGNGTYLISGSTRNGETAHVTYPSGNRKGWLGMYTAITSFQRWAHFKLVPAA